MEATLPFTVRAILAPAMQNEYLHVAITVQNGSNGKWVRPLTWHVGVPAILRHPPVVFDVRIGLKAQS